MTSAVSLKLAGAIALLATLLFSFGLRLWWMRATPPVPELLQGLGDSAVAENQQAYIDRLRARFPIGSSEAALMGALRDQGFRIEPGPGPSETSAAFDRSGGFEDRCRRGGSARWTKDAAGHIAAIAGGYYVHCP
jgi:hypothetical protein